MKFLLSFNVVCLVVAIFGCGEDLPEDGSINGECRLSEMPCDEGLSCETGICRVDTTETPLALTIELELLERDVVADGMSTLEFQLLVNETESNAPFTGELFVYAEPAGVGSVTPGLLSVEDGFGFGTYRACDRRNDVSCPEVMYLRIARAEDPMNAIFESESFRQVSPEITSETRLDLESCQQIIGARTAVKAPGIMGESIHSTDTNPWKSGSINQLVIETSSLSMTLPMPDEQERRYQALTPDMVNVEIILPESTGVESSDNAMTPPMSRCLRDGVWVGSQTLEFWSETDELDVTTNHVVSIIALDCFDERDRYAVVRACAHGTR